MSRVLVAERSRRVDALWGFLTVVFAAALLRGLFGSGGVAILVIFGALLAASVGAWVWFRRHPAQLEITAEAVAFSHRGQKATRLTAPGELSIHTTHIGGTDRLHFLKIVGSDEAIPLQMFDHDEVKAACRAGGWRFVDDARPADIVHELARRMCEATSTSEEGLLGALGVRRDPPPLGGTAVRVRGGDIPTFEVDLPAGVLTRADLDGVLGPSQLLPRTGPYASFLLRYVVEECSVFARFEEEPGPSSPVAGVLWRLDR